MAKKNIFIFTHTMTKKHIFIFTHTGMYGRGHYPKRQTRDDMANLESRNKSNR